ncbi:DUF2490 domain-containing protein [Saprospira grandis]|uniref:DUF2490 domain-containing protein n=1 Tax=Saprospira grandis (strain Lewin) TaxID=984262 RepID=H6L8Q0_SAPGL|nr:DUF2490 domain-containing protein [Saprospira grandis]AFC26856.1 hypothetical protein SGRA_4141 [Saprospira grandis str. Lewin]
MRYLFFFFLLVKAGGLYAQEFKQEQGILSELLLRYKHNNSWRSGFKLEHFAQFPPLVHSSFNAQYFLDYKTNRGLKLAWGYRLAQDAGQAISHRFIQQLAWGQKLSLGQLGHRFRLEGNWGGQRRPEYRLRYRLSLERPLMGQKINAKELYWQASEELLPGWRPEGGQYENRLAISLGYRSAGAWRLLLGIEQRLRFRPRALRQQIWGKIYYIYAIN